MKKNTLKDVCKKITSGGTPPTKKGEYYNGNIPWLRTQEVKFCNIYDTEIKITQSGIDNSSAKIIPENSVIVAMYGATAGKSAINKIPLSTNQACCNLIVDEKVADYRYVYYYLVNSYERLLSSATGAAQQNLSVKQISEIEIGLPKIEKQKKIADILGNLDEKIEINRRMNEALEQIGQTLFRHYFIDNPDVKNWKTGTIDDLGGIITGKTPSKKIDEYFGKDMPFLKVPDMHNKSVIINTNDGLTILGVEFQKNKTIAKYSTCVSCIATVGVVSLSGVDLQTNQQINSIVPRQKHYRFYNYYAMRHKSDYIKTLASSGSATPNLNRGQFAKISVALPPDEVLKSFDERAESVFEQIIENTYQIDVLIKIRDSLLPKLISGERGD